VQLGAQYNDWLRAHLERQFLGVRDLRQSAYVDWPAHVHLETFAICNARCTFCPYPTLERKGTRMADALIDKILGDLEEIPSDVPFQIAPYKVSEPFLDLRLLDLLEDINARLPHAGLNIFSNGSIMKEDQLRRMARLKSVNFLWISLNECDPARYEALMSLPFERTIERLSILHTLKSNGTFPHNV